MSHKDARRIRHRFLCEKSEQIGISNVANVFLIVLGASV